MVKHRRCIAILALALALFACDGGEPAPTTMPADPGEPGEATPRGPCTLDVIVKGAVQEPPYVVELTPGSPVQVLFKGEGWGRIDIPGRPVVKVFTPDRIEILPGWSMTEGAIEVPMELNKIGVWHFSIVSTAAGCRVEIPIVVRLLQPG